MAANVQPGPGPGARACTHTSIGRAVKRGILLALAATAVMSAAATAATTPSISAQAYDGTFASLSGSGWVGGDATNSVALPDGRDCWIFSDTITSMSPTNLQFAHNSIVITGHGRPQVIDNPMPSPSRTSYYWAGAARVHGGQVWEIAERMVQTGPKLFDYHLAGDYLAKISMASWRLVSITPLPGTTGGTINWGVALLDDGPYTYIYGSEFQGIASWMHVARVPKGRLDLPWSYDTATGWRRGSPTASLRLLAGVSPAFSLANLGPHRGIRLISQQPVMGQEIDSWHAATPTGPFTDRHAIYTTPSYGPRTYTYNTLTHPEQTTSAGVLFSYNVNSYDPLTPADATLYRPRFFRVPPSAL